MTSKTIKKMLNTYKQRIQHLFPGDGVEGHRELLVKGYKLSGIERISSGDLMYSIMTS